MANLAFAQSPTSNGGDPLFCQPDEGATFLIINGGSGLFTVDPDCYNSNIGTPPSNTPPGPTIATTQGGTMTLNLTAQGGNYTYTPPTPNFVGLDTFTIHVTTTWNAQGGPGSAGGTFLARPGGADNVVVTLNVLPSEYILQVAGVPKLAPIPTGSVIGCGPQGNAGQGPASSVVGGCVTALALAPFNEQTSITSAHGTVNTVGAGTGQTIRYTPTVGYTGPDSFRFNIFGTNTDGSTALNAGTGAVPAAGPGNPLMRVEVNPPLVISPGSPLPAGSRGTPYSQTFTVTGGFPGYTPLSVVAGALPPGLTLSGGVLSGTPTAAGVYNFSIQVADNALGGSALAPTSNPNTVTQAFQLVVAEPLPLVPTPLLDRWALLLLAGLIGAFVLVRHRRA